MSMSWPDIQTISDVKLVIIKSRNGCLPYFAAGSCNFFPLIVMTFFCEYCNLKMTLRNAFPLMGKKKQSIISCCCRDQCEKNLHSCVLFPHRIKADTVTRKVC